MNLTNNLADQAWLGFTFCTPKAYMNGFGYVEDMDTLFRLPGLGHFELGMPWDGVSALLQWHWADGVACPGTRDITVVLPEIPGPDTFHLLLTWNRPSRQFSIYLNGTPIRLPDLPEFAWAAAPVGEMAGNLRFQISDLKYGNAFLPAPTVSARVPAELAGRHREVFGLRPERPRIEVDARRGELLYASTLATPDSATDWVQEAGKYSFVDGWMQVESEFPGATNSDTGHMNIWCPIEFPAAFVAEWEVRVLKEHLCIVFFAATGDQGEDIFSPALPSRKDGSFIHYIKERVCSYHISYSAAGRGISNLRKNNKFWLLTTGPEGIPTGSREPHRIRLIKGGAHIQLLVDDRLVIDYRDDQPERYGPAYGHGRIGLRQMRNMIGQYRNFRVWALRPTAPCRSSRNNQGATLSGADPLKRVTPPNPHP